jgi:hypothetical protein
VERVKGFEPSTSCLGSTKGKRQEFCLLYNMVAHTGFEPVISSLRGRCPKPLDECATPKLGKKDSNLPRRIQSPLSYR